jgi:hypothetical protein
MSRTINAGALLLLLILTIIVLEPILTKSVIAQSMLKPSIPEFTLKFVDSSYCVPASNTTSIDPFTGNKTVINRYGYYMENKSIAVSIQNQPFTPYKDANGNYVDLYYDIRWKGHFGDNWWDYNSTFKLLLNSFSGFDNSGFPLPNSEFKIISFPMGEDVNGHMLVLGNISAGGKVDFQVKAFLGYYTQAMYPSVPGFRDASYYVFHGESSSWSNIQTITVPESTNSAIPNGNPTPTVPEFQIVTTMTMLFATSLSLIVFRRNRGKQL